jgi:hypothetical protein
MLVYGVINDRLKRERQFQAHSMDLPAPAAATLNQIREHPRNLDRAVHLSD